MSKKETKNIILFFIISFIFSWSFWVPQVLIAQGVIFPRIIVSYLNSPFNIAAFGPFVAALILTYYENKSEGIKTLLKRGVNYDFPKRWFIPIFLLFPLLTFMTVLMDSKLNNMPLDLTMLTKPWTIFYWFVYMLLLGGPLQEEFGWRGYVLGKLQQRHSALMSSIILGIFWALWHFPLNFTKNAVAPNYSEVASMIIGSIITITILSILFTWIFNNTNQSVLAVLLLHASLNLSTFKLFPVFNTQMTAAYYSLLILITAILVVTIFGKRTFVKKQTPVVSHD